MQRLSKESDYYFLILAMQHIQETLCTHIDASQQELLQQAAE